jgi:rRNA maturation protein Rpf1
MFTTSRYASSKARELARRMAVEAGEPFLSRGKHTIDQLAGIAGISP